MRSAASKPPIARTSRSSAPPRARRSTDCSTTVTRLPPAGSIRWARGRSATPSARDALFGGSKRWGPRQDARAAGPPARQHDRRRAAHASAADALRRRGQTVLTRPLPVNGKGLTLLKPSSPNSLGKDFHGLKFLPNCLGGGLRWGSIRGSESL